MVCKRLTVYFDTSFFVWLRQANSEVASETVNSLNSLQVRHVLSDAVIVELLASSRNPDDNALLVDRVRQLELPPYLTRDSITWEVLLSQGQLRAFVSDVLKLSDDWTTDAKSHAIVARRIGEGRISAKQMVELQDSMKPFLEEFGFSLNPADQDKNLAAARTFAENLMMGLKDVLPDGTIAGEFKCSGDPVEDSQMILGLLKSSDLERAKESNRLSNSTTSFENRPFQVATGTASAALKNKLAHTLRDSEHMSTFVLHRKEIDFLQVDKAQLNLIRNPNHLHRINELGLADRCFNASSLVDMVNVLRRLAQ